MTSIASFAPSAPSLVILSHPRSPAKFLKEQCEKALHTSDFTLVRSLLKMGLDPNVKLAIDGTSTRLLNMLCLLHAPLDLVRLCLEKGAQNDTSLLFEFIASIEMNSFSKRSSYPIDLLHLLALYNFNFYEYYNGKSILHASYELYGKLKCDHLKQIIKFLLKKYTFSISSYQTIKIQQFDPLNHYLSYNRHLFKRLRETTSGKGYKPLIGRKIYELSKTEKSDLIKDQAKYIGLFNKAVKFSKKSLPKELSRNEKHAWEILFNQISEGDTSIQIDPSTDFKPLVLNALKELLHYPSGRAIILLLVRQKHPLFITNAKHSTATIICANDPELPLIISLDLNHFHNLTCFDKERNQIPHQQKPFLRLGHELVHALHFLIDARMFDKLKRTPAWDENYTNLNELLTIEGGIAFPFCENSLRKESGNPERYGHVTYFSESENEEEPIFRAKRRKTQKS